MERCRHRGMHGRPKKLFPCSFFSCNLSPTESNYNICSQELLAIKVTIDEWRHWLEGTLNPFSVLTDHVTSNTVYPPGQMLKLSVLHMFPFYNILPPGFKKANAFSCIFKPPKQPTNPEPIIPTRLTPFECMLGHQPPLCPHIHTQKRTEKM